MKKKVLSSTDWDKIKEIADVDSLETSTEATVYLIRPKTTIGPQAMAMIQALYSRDPASILWHLLEVARKGADAFMAQYYVGYGHKSIGDLGNILLAFEGISMLAAKAIQDSQLYAGQEASTRYIDFSDQLFLAPDDGTYKTALVSTSHKDDVRINAQGIQEAWRDFYMRYLPIVQQHVMDENPYESYDFTEMLKEKPELNTHALWVKTMKARAFDIMRGFLPAGATTSVAWWTSISHCGDHLSWLRCHILPEVVELAQKSEEILKAVYPSSFTREVYEEREAYKCKWYATEYYLELPETFSDVFERFECSLRQLGWWAPRYKEAVLTRPKGVELPWQIGECLEVYWADLIDFGSYRDQQRHRAVIQRMGLITAKYGMHEWYMQNLPADVATTAKELVKNQLQEIESLGLNKYETQYLLPMGMKVPTRTIGSLSKFMYLIELRCQTTVHPTMHENTFRLAQRLRWQIAQIFDCDDEQIPMFIDEQVGRINLKRATQDIVKKKVVE